MKHIIISGGGISGLTLANLASRLGMKCTVIERAKDCCRATAGGGIGLWGPSLSVIDLIPGAKHEMMQHGSWMPFPSYRDSNGKFIARATSSFGDRFPVLCLNRDDILKTLYKFCHQDEGEHKVPITIMNELAVTEYKIIDNGVQVTLSNGTSISGDILVAADGIHSHIRTQLMKELNAPKIVPKFLNYTYFRANVDFPDSEDILWHASSFEAWGRSSSGAPIRFGYVPLKKPQVFWFIAIPTGKDTVVPQGIPVSLIDENTKQWLLEQVKFWQGPRDENGKLLVDYRVLISSSHHILRTDIHKIENVTSFPWKGHNSRVILTGDSAHATAPNIAQGAGLCIEDCATLAEVLSRIPEETWNDSLNGAIAEYEKLRKPRASTVQFVADNIAIIGQLKNPGLIFLRNFFMKTGTTIFPTIQRRIFEAAVSYSLAGTKTQRTWLPPVLQTYPPLNKDAPNSIAHAALDKQSLLGRILSEEDMKALPKHVREFKTSQLDRWGTGTVSVEKGNILARIIGYLAGLPPAMNNERFDASVTQDSAHIQKWTRIFGVGTPLATKYSTTHSARVGFTQTFLTEGVGGWLDSFIKFRYNVVLRKEDKALCYSTAGIEILGYQLPIPRWLSVNSHWVEIPTEKGWTFDGEISFPLIGRIMRYYGNFEVVSPPQVSSKNRAIISGGTGMVGRAVASYMVSCGWEVYVLSRRSTGKVPFGVKIAPWDGKTAKGWSDLINENTVLINLAGENPGAHRWTKTSKEKIVNSRLSAISAMKEAVQLATQRNTAPRAFLQASAAGIAGNSGSTIIDDNFTPSPTQTNEFRVSCCVALEEEANKAVSGTPTPVTYLRLGHVLSDRGGLFPYMDLASLFRGSRLGRGDQYVSWVHIDDVAKCIAFISQHPKKFEGPLNLTSPNPATNSEFMKELGKARRRSVFIPVPSFALRMAIGESSCVLLDSERLVPKKLMENNYEFKYPSLDTALCSL